MRGEWSLLSLFPSAGCDKHNLRPVRSLLCRPVMGAVCVVVLLDWAQGYRCDKRARERWQLRRGMSHKDELEKRRRVLEEMRRQG